MTKITQKQKEAISEIYLLSIVSIDLRYKLSFLTQLYSGIRSALLAANIIEYKDINSNSSIVVSTDKDEFNSAKLLNESKNKLYDAYTTLATKSNWIGAEQIAIEITERLTSLGYLHEFIDVDVERWNASYAMLSPYGGAATDGD